MKRLQELETQYSDPGSNSERVAEEFDALAEEIEWIELMKNYNFINFLLEIAETLKSL